MGGPKAPPEIHWPLGPIFYPIGKAKIIVDCLENQSRARDLCDWPQSTRGGSSQSPAGYHRWGHPCKFPTLWSFKRNIVLEIRKGLWFWWLYKWMSPVSPKKMFCAFNTSIQSCLRLGHVSARFKEARIITAEPAQDPKFPWYLRPISLLCTTSKLFEEPILKTKHRGKKHTKFKSVWLSSKSQYVTSMHEAGGLRHLRFEQ
jgi:hypothetical protein